MKVRDGVTPEFRKNQESTAGVPPVTNQGSFKEVLERQLPKLDSAAEPLDFSHRISTECIVSNQGSGIREGEKKNSGKAGRDTKRNAQQIAARQDQQQKSGEKESYDGRACLRKNHGNCREGEEQTIPRAIVLLFGIIQKSA